MNRNSLIDMINHTRLLDGVAVFDDATSFSPNSGYNNLRERHYMAIMDADVLIRERSSPQDEVYALPRPSNLTHLTLVPSEGVAILEISGGMQLESQDTSYEQLLELEERIGNVSTGLSEQTIASMLRTRTYSLSPKSTNPEAQVCTICQEEYKKQDTIGSLSCRHEYHADCLKKWLVLKNECPICRSTGLTVD